MNQDNERSNSAGDDSFDDGASLDQFKQLITELHIARLSEPTDETRQRYYQMIEHVEKRSGLSPIGIWRTIQAVLSWDSRTQSALQGTRGSGAGNFRLLYATAHTEIELMIETHTERNYIDGDIVSLSKSTTLSDEQTPALITLMRAASTDETIPDQAVGSGENAQAYETESDTHGRFRFENITNGLYTMQILLLNGALIEIDQLELL